MTELLTIATAARRRALRAFVASAGLFALALAMPLVAEAQATGTNYRLGSGDAISVSVTEAPEFNRSAELDESGAFTLSDDMGSVNVNGLTVQEAEAAISRRLLRQLRTATVSIIVDQERSSTVRIVGAVNSPGDRQIGRNETLFELLTRGDDLDRAKAAGTVLVRRGSSSGFSEQIEIALDELLQQAQPRLNIPLRNGDLITVPAGRPMTVYFVGEIATQISFEASEPKTLLTAVAKAGGLTERSSGKIEIRRVQADGSRTTLTGRFKRILEGKDDDIPLQQGDVINVKRSVL